MVDILLKIYEKCVISKNFLAARQFTAAKHATQLFQWGFQNARKYG